MFLKEISQFLIAKYLKVPNSYFIKFYVAIFRYDAQHEAYCKMQSINNCFSKKYSKTNIFCCLLNCLRHDANNSKYLVARFIDAEFFNY